MDGEKRVTVRLPADDLALITSLVSDKKFETESDFVRTAVSDLLAQFFTPEQREKTLAAVSRLEGADISDFTADGSGAEDVLREALDRSMSDRKEF